MRFDDVSCDVLWLQHQRGVSSLRHGSALGVAASQGNAQVDLLAGHVAGLSGRVDSHHGHGVPYSSAAAARDAAAAREGRGDTQDLDMNMDMDLDLGMQPPMSCPPQPCGVIQRVSR